MRWVQQYYRFRTSKHGSDIARRFVGWVCWRIVHAHGADRPDPRSEREADRQAGGVLTAAATGRGGSNRKLGDGSNVWVTAAALADVGWEVSEAFLR